MTKLHNFTVTVTLPQFSHSHSPAPPHPRNGVPGAKAAALGITPVDPWHFEVRAENVCEVARTTSLHPSDVLYAFYAACYELDIFAWSELIFSDALYRINDRLLASVVPETFANGAHYLDEVGIGDGFTTESKIHKYWAVPNAVWIILACHCVGKVVIGCETDRTKVAFKDCSTTSGVLSLNPHVFRLDNKTEGFIYGNEAFNHSIYPRSRPSANDKRYRALAVRAKHNGHEPDVRLAVLEHCASWPEIEHSGRWKVFQYDMADILRPVVIYSFWTPGNAILDIVFTSGRWRTIVPTNQTFDSRHQSPNYEARVSRDGSVLREGMTSNQFPGETQNSSLYPPQSAGLNYPWQVSCVTDSDGMPIQTLVRAVSVANQGPVAAPGGIRIVSKQQSGRPTSQALPAEKFEPLLAHAVPEPAARRHTLTTRIRLLVAVLRRAHGGD
ncbi:hypothetical protein C2E23DRAFT_857306 [Lenzites betulinus]|nr:hypothetical protein C2E23DRAFT_857306 [Lenzites betulinus]